MGDKYPSTQRETLLRAANVQSTPLKGDFWLANSHLERYVSLFQTATVVSSSLMIFL